MPKKKENNEDDVWVNDKIIHCTKRFDTHLRSIFFLGHLKRQGFDVDVKEEKKPEPETFIGKVFWMTVTAIMIAVLAGLAAVIIGFIAAGLYRFFVWLF